MSDKNLSFTVNTSSGNYPVHIKCGILSELKSHLEASKGKLSIITDENVNNLYGSVISLGLGDLSACKLILPSGESSKSFKALYPFYEEFIKAGLDRRSKIVAIGGGVTGDAVGFLASTYLRGIDFIQVPTTLLSMVDSSIGGKVGINHELGKNLIGSFYPPKMVIIDPEFLVKLPDREYLSGLAECIKHALISGDVLFKETLKLKNGLKNKDLNILPEFIYNNLQVKKNIVEEDEKESGVRAYLNLGHTFAHALENYFNYGTLLHGEAVCLGLIAALRLSEEVLGLNQSVRTSLTDFLTYLGLPTTIQNLDINKLNDLMTRDKKTIGGKTNFVLLKAVGEPVLFSEVNEEMLGRAWASIME
jgi:3-dehydroquinate synthase